MTIEIICPDTGLQVFGSRKSCERGLDNRRETAYRCRHCGWWHPGPKLKCKVTGKRRYATQRSCEADIEKAWTDPEWKGADHGRMPRRAYECPHCRSWHMSTSSRTLAELAAQGHGDPDLPLRA